MIFSLSLFAIGCGLLWLAYMVGYDQRRKDEEREASARALEQVRHSISNPRLTGRGVNST